jgi:hypothetical protein
LKLQYVSDVGMWVIMTWNGRIVVLKYTLSSEFEPDLPLYM